MLQLRNLLKDTIAWQARFAALRMERALPKMLAAAPAAERDRIRANFYRVAREPLGLYALMDYVNFKGEGVSPSERYRGQGWGLLQVLETMPATGPAIPAFVKAADKRLDAPGGQFASCSRRSEVAARMAQPSANLSGLSAGSALKASMTKDEVGRVLQNIARLLELKGENPFKIRAYVNAARALEGIGEDLSKLIAEDRLREVEGIGKAIAEKITTLAQTGKLDYYDNLRDAFPPEIFVLFELQGLGARKIKALYETLGISSITKLERACQEGRIALLPGFGPKSAENILAAIEKYRRSVGQFRLGDVMALAERLLEDLRGHPSVILCEIAGSYRRKKEIIRDLDFIISTRSPAEVFEDFVNHPQVESVIARGDTKTSVSLVSGIQCDLRAVTTAEYPFALNYFTGSKEHNVRMRTRALERGWSLNEYRFSRAEGRELKQPLPDVHFEADIYRALGLAYIQPELREDRGEVEAAESGRLPDLIEWPNLRGTFHCHTVDSDGQATLEEMAAAAQESGDAVFGHCRSQQEFHSGKWSR